MTPVPVKLGIRLVVLAAFLVAPFARSAAAATVTVPGNYPTIQAAINAVLNGAQPDGTTINVQAGTYHEFLSIGANSKSFTVRAVGGVVIVDAGGFGAPAVGVSFATGQIVFEGLTFRNGIRSEGGGFFVQNSSPSFVNCVFESNTGTVNGGGGALLGSNATFTGCTIRNNSAANFGGGVLMREGSHPVFTNCDIVSNVSGTGAPGAGSGAGGGVFSLESSPTFHGSRINGNTSKFASGGIHHQGVFGSPHGPSMLVMDDSEVGSNLSSEFPGNNPAEGGGMHVEDNATATLTRVRIHHNQAGTGGGLNVFRGRFDITDSVIESNQGTNGIGGGITAASNFASPQMPGSIVNLTRTLVRNNTAITGGGIVTLGDNFSSEPARLSITNSVVDHNTAQNQGGGILANKTVLTISSSLIINNVVSGGATPFGGGLMINAESTATINATTIAHNTAGQHGGGLFVASAINMSGSNVYDNTAGTRGGGLFVGGGLPQSGTIQNSTIADNHPNTGQINEDACTSVNYPNNLITPTAFSVCSPGSTIASRAPGTNTSSPPRFQVFLAVPSSGTSMTLAWSVARALTVTVAGVGTWTSPTNAPTGTIDVTPASSTTYSMTATASGANGGNYSTPANVAVTVVRPPTGKSYVDGDFDGDGNADITVFRPSTGIWYVRNVVTGLYEFYQWGLNGDIPVIGDYDGDGKADSTVWRPSTGIWYIRNSSDGASAFLQWGLTGDIPVPGDYDGDGKADAAVFRPSTGIWYVRDLATNAATFYQWGLSGDVPVSADYDGDGKTDVAVWRPSTGIWYILNSSNGATVFLQWGLTGDIAAPGDYDGDGKADSAVFRPSTGIWYVRDLVTNTALFYQWGLNGDVPVPGDFDGDGLTDVAVFRPSTSIWYVRPSSDPAAPGFYQWGVSGDIPILKRQ